MSKTTFCYHFFRGLVLFNLSFIIVAALLLSTPHSSADTSSVDGLTISIPSSCTLTSTVNTAHSASTIGGTYMSGIGTTTLKTVCNDSNGFVIYTIGSSNNEDGNNKLVSSASSSYDIASGTATSGNISNWAMKLTPVSGAYTPNMEEGYNDQYVTVPTTWTKVASRPANTDITTDASAAGSSMTTTYAVYVNSVQPAGAYTGQVKYAMLHPSSSTKPTTLAQAYKNAGKTKVYTEDPITGDSGYFYTMQDMSSSICNAVNVYGEASQTQLVDTRDGKLYWATKLHTDKYNGNIGQCWMTENLDLDLETTPNKVAALTSENTNLKLYGDKGYTSDNGYTCSNASTTTNCTATGETITWTPERDTIPPDDLSSTWANDNINPYSYDGGAVEPDGHKDGHGYSGNYYNWTAAIASNNSSSYSGGNAANSICPKGWRLPNARAEEGGYEFTKVFYAYNAINNTNSVAFVSGGYNRVVGSPLYYVRSGVISNGSFTSLANMGFYLSSANYGNIVSLLRFFNSTVNGSIRSDYGESKYTGVSIRCIAE